MVASYVLLDLLPLSEGWRNGVGVAAISDDPSSSLSSGQRGHFSDPPAAMVGDAPSPLGGNRPDHRRPHFCALILTLVCPARHRHFRALAL